MPDLLTDRPQLIELDYCEPLVLLDPDEEEPDDPPEEDCTPLEVPAMPEQARCCWDRIAKELPTKGLQALLTALETDSQALIQHDTCHPAARSETDERQPYAACAIGYAGWHSGLGTVGEVDGFFYHFPVPAGPFVDWFDNADRAEMRLNLIPHVRAELARRKP